MFAAATETVDGQDYFLAAEVGLLTRNIKIIGEPYAKQDKEAFGARVIISSTTALDGTEYNGKYQSSIFLYIILSFL